MNERAKHYGQERVADGQEIHAEAEPIESLNPSWEMERSGEKNEKKEKQVVLK